MNTGKAMTLVIEGDKYLLVFDSSGDEQLKILISKNILPRNRINNNDKHTLTA